MISQIYQLSLELLKHVGLEKGPIYRPFVSFRPVEKQVELPNKSTQHVSYSSFRQSVVAVQVTCSFLADENSTGQTITYDG